MADFVLCVMLPTQERRMEELQAVSDVDKNIHPRRLSLGVVSDACIYNLMALVKFADGCWPDVGEKSNQTMDIDFVEDDT